MKKEIIICIIVIIFVVILNVITGNYTKECVESLKTELESVKSELKNETNMENISKNILIMKSNWDNRHDKLAYYIEHDELEKVDLYLVGLESNVKSNEYSQAIEELDKCIFILEHIEEKYNFNLKNIF